MSLSTFRVQEGVQKKKKKIAFKITDKLDDGRKCLLWRRYPHELDASTHLEFGTPSRKSHSHPRMMASIYDAMILRQ